MNTGFFTTVTHWIKTGFVVSELTRDGLMVIRRFIPSSETQQLDSFSHLSIDSDDRVFVADVYRNRVILLDSDLKLNRILCPTKEEKEKQIIKWPRRPSSSPSFIQAWNWHSQSANSGGVQEVG